MTGRPPRPSSKVCVLCGQNPATTRDHLLPEALLLNLYPDNLITVQACEACIAGGSLHDDEFQAFLAMHVAGWDKRGVQFFQERGRTNLEGNARHRRALQEGVRLIEPQGPGGEPLGQAPAILWDSEAHDAVVEWMIRELYWHYTGQILPQGAIVEPHWYQGITSEMLAPFLVEGQEGVGIRRFGNNEVAYADCTHPQAPGYRLWLFQFFGAHSCGGHTRPADSTAESGIWPSDDGEVFKRGHQDA